ncbi:Coiled-coil domain-containing protein 13 [Terramyces sp. JEL0728]|nr:Coiled-coil domain-containing protein 13 [Terramyces sp. JEL0728]KAJ3273195.1 Coiled-coil domain-containing protein 13 [Terramyces sp. JEL0728]
MLAPLGNYKVGINPIQTPKLNKLEKNRKYQIAGKFETLSSDESQDEDAKSLHTFTLKSNSGSKPLDIIKEDIVSGRQTKSDSAAVIETLRKEMKAKDGEIKSLRKELQDGLSLVATEDAISDSFQNGNFQQAKIIELAKKARRLTVQYEKEKTKNMMLLGRIKELETPLVEDVKSAANIKSLQGNTKEKLFYSMRKLEEERMHNQTLKQDARTLTKLLQKEVGDSVSVEQLLKGENNWKGRGEQIIILKEKIKELQRKCQSESKANTPIPSTPVVKPNSRIEELKRKDLEKAIAEAEKCKSDYSELKKRTDGLQSRIRILETDNKEYRSKIKILLDKSENDDKLISALKQELKKQKKHIENKNSTVFQNLKSICAEQQETIQNLEARIAKMADIKPVESNEIQGLQVQIAQFTLLIETYKNEIKSLRESKAEVAMLYENEKNANGINSKLS